MEALDDLILSFYHYRNTDIYLETVPSVEKLETFLVEYLEYVRETKHQVFEDILSETFDQDWLCPWKK